ncbi:hypothetical protein EI94DRAFT_1734420 [Lactarius quietus]|nr:hypothetical protein EI94DRAFT_1734420 [Lactarius quietus]
MSRVSAGCADWLTAIALCFPTNGHSVSVTIERPAMAEWRTSSCKDCRHGEHSYYASSGLGLENEIERYVCDWKGETSTIYTRSGHKGRSEGTVTITVGSPGSSKSEAPNPQHTSESNKVCPGLWRAFHRTTGEWTVTGSCGDSNVNTALMFLD